MTWVTIVCGPHHAAGLIEYSVPVSWRRLGEQVRSRGHRLVDAVGAPSDSVPLPVPLMMNQPVDSVGSENAWQGEGVCAPRLSASSKYIPAIPKSAPNRRVHIAFVVVIYSAPLMPLTIREGPFTDSSLWLPPFYKS